MKAYTNTLFQKNAFYLASFGAACIASLIFVLLISILFLLTNVSLPLTSGIWIFLFIFPGTLVLASFLITPNFNSKKPDIMLYRFIVGYAAYSLVSFLILLLGSSTEPIGWVFLVLVLVAVAIFNSERVFNKLGVSEVTATDMAEDLSEVNINLLPFKDLSPMSEPEKPRTQDKNISEAKQSSEKELSRKDTDGGENTSVSSGVIHLGPRK